MPSRKRNKGKARKAKAAGDNSGSGPGTPQKERQAQHQRQCANRQLARRLTNLSINETECFHGFPLLPPGDVWTDRSFFAIAKAEGVMISLFDQFDLVDNDDLTKSPMLVFATAHRILEKDTIVKSVWYNPSCARTLIAGFVSIATMYLLKGQDRDIDMASAIACATLNIEHLQPGLTTGEGDLDLVTRNGKMRDLGHGGEREAVRFFSKRTQCDCLQEKYARSKSQPKVGVCSFCKEKKERSTLMVCASCQLCQYCSKGCQNAHWPQHKECCAEIEEAYKKSTREREDRTNREECLGNEL